MIPEDVRRDLYSEVVIARASAYSSEQWVSVICDTIERHIERVPCLRCVALTRQSGSEQTCTWCAAGGSHGWRWKLPIVLDDDGGLLAVVAAPGSGSRSDVPPSNDHAVHVGGWWPGEGDVA